MKKYDFEYCQKLVIISKDKTKVLLCKRKGEEDYNGTFSFPGGKMEITDGSLIKGLGREKNEELGEQFKINILITYSTNVYFQKKNGKHMILPHYLAIHKSGKITLSNEYSEYQWISIKDINEFEPKIQNIPEIIQTLQRLDNIALEIDYYEI